MTRHQLELIERYLEQKMGEAEMAQFENAMLHDPLLKSEFELQKDIIESIKDYRKAEIKARLDQINVNPAPHFANFMKIAASITVTSLMIWGAYTYFNDSEIEDVYRVNISESTNESHMEYVPNIPLARVDNPIIADSDMELNTIRRSSRAYTRKEIKFPEVRLPDVLMDFGDTSPLVEDEGLPKPHGDFPAIDDKSLAPEILIKELPGRKNQYFYQNYDGKLYLYGNFSNSPYELIELNTENGRRLFLKYDSDYFAIKSDQKDITPLETIQDSSLIQELKILKNNIK